MSRAPSISIITPAYNAEGTLARTVASLQAQTNPDWEIVIVDDGSTDGTAALMERLAAEEPRITTASQTNGGASSARNTAMKLATGRWMMFLDADDDFAPDAVEVMLAAAAKEKDPRWLYAGWKRILPTGGVELYPPMVIEDAVEICAQYCPFAISVSLVDRELVLSLGGFDSSLRTCEDWDLWLRMAIAGAKPVAVQSFVANYNARAQSLSTDARSMIGDGIQVIDRGHAASKRTDAQRRSARLAHLAWTSGLMLGLGQDPSELLERLDDPYAPDVDPGAVAGALIIAIPLGGLDTADHWAHLKDEDHIRITNFLNVLERVTGSPRLARRVARRLEQMVSEATDESGGRIRLGAAVIVDVDLESPPGDLDLGPEVERLYLRARLDGKLVGATAEVPVFGHHVPAAVMLDVLMENAGWDALEKFILTPLLPSLHVEAIPGEGWTIMRGGTRIAPVLVEKPTDRQLLDATGWALFMQELWGDPALEMSGLYEQSTLVPAKPRPAGAHTTLDIADDLPELECREPAVTVEVTLGGAPLDCFTLAADEDGRVTAARLRAQICIRAGVELATTTLRVLLANGYEPGADLRERLSELAAMVRASRGQTAGQPGLGAVWQATAREFAGDASAVRIVGRPIDTVPVPASFRLSLLGGDAARIVERTSAALWAPIADVPTGGAGPPLVVRAPVARSGGHGAPTPPDAKVFVPEWDEPEPEAEPELTNEAEAELARALSRRSLRWIRNRFRGASDRHDQRGETEEPEIAVPAGGMRLPIMMYHRVAPDGPKPMRRYRVTPQEFRAQLELYTRDGYTAIRPEQWRDAVCLGTPLPKKPILLSFDDGFQDFYDHAAPLLEEFGMTGSVMLVGDLIGKWNQWDGDRDPQPLMNWDAIDDLRSRGFDFGGHTLIHRPLSALGADEIVQEIAGSMEAIRERHGDFPTSFAYPFGDCSDAVRRLAGASGVQLALSVDSGVATKASDLLRLPRIEVYGEQPLPLLRQWMST